MKWLLWPCNKDGDYHSGDTVSWLPSSSLNILFWTELYVSTNENILNSNECHLTAELGSFCFIFRLAPVCTPISTWFFGSTRVYLYPSGILSSSAIFAWLTCERYVKTCRSSPHLALLAVLVMLAKIGTVHLTYNTDECLPLRVNFSLDRTNSKLM